LGSFSHRLPGDIGELPAGEIIRQYRLVQRSVWQQTRRQVTAVELGVNRALITAFGGKRLPDLPVWEDVIQKEKKPKLPAWMIKFERANPDRQVKNLLPASTLTSK
jgi:hypothetical protein